MQALIQDDVAIQEFLLDPFAHFRRWRHDEPVRWSEPLHGWMLTRYDDVVSAFRDPRLRQRPPQAIVDAKLPPGRREVARDFVRLFGGMMLMKEGPEHARLRRVGNQGFTQGVLDGFRPILQRVTDEILDKVEPLGRMDVVRDLAQPLPAAAIAHMFGIPDADRGLFLKWSEDAARFFGDTTLDVEEDAKSANEATCNLGRYFLTIIDERRMRPSNDLVSIFVAGQQQGKLSAEEVTAQCVLVLAAGHVTTIDQLGNAVHALLMHPDQLNQLRENPALIRSAVEECLRYDGSVPFVCRVAAEDLKIRDKRIQRCQTVFLGIASANRDPEIFDEPDRFDITRAPGRHIAFGFGPHGCLGAGLACRELEIGLVSLIRRMPGLKLDDQSPPVRRCESVMFRGFRRLPVVFSRAQTDKIA